MILIPPPDLRYRRAAEVCEQLQKAGFRSLLAGGCVRDMLLGVPPKDYDIATAAQPGEVRACFPHVHPVGEAFGVMLVITDEGPIEVATFRKDGFYSDGRRPSKVTFSDEIEDAQRRDFSINALFFDTKDHKVLDYVDGRKDLKNELIRAVGSPLSRFEEDHLRLLRAVRFAARLGFRIDPHTMTAIRACAALVKDVSAERVGSEIVKMLTEGAAGRALRLLEESGLLQHVLPEVAAMRGCEQPPEFHPEGDVFVHTALVLDLLQNPSPALGMAALLHDVGKPPTQTQDDRIRFNHHDKVGAAMTRDICNRLRLSGKVTERAEWLVSQHMRLADTPHMREAKRKRFVRQEGFDELLRLGRADCLASHENVDGLDWIEGYLASLSEEEVAPPPLLTGTDLIALGYTPGPRFQEILQAVEDKQLEGELSATPEARAWVKTHFPLK